MDSNSVSTISKLDKYLFIAWFVTMPFGSKLLAIELPGFTLYPSLILAVVLFVSLIKGVGFPKALVGLKWASPLFLLTFLGFTALFWANGRSDVLFDIRGLLLFSLWVSIFILAAIRYGNSAMSFLSEGLWAYWGIIVSFGVFEFFTGIHFAGKHTDKLWDLPVSLYTYAPTFIWDNPNTYIAFLALISGAILLLSKNIRDQLSLQLLVFIPLFFFSVIANSRLGVLLSATIGMIFLAIQLRIFWGEFKKIWIYLAGGMICLLMTYFINERYIGPMWQDGDHYRSNGILAIELDDDGGVTLKDKKELISAVSEDSLNLALKEYTFKDQGSGTLRKNLIVTGLDYWKSSPIVGVGAGQYRYLSEQGKNKLDIGTLRSPHNLTVEVVSQYGVIGMIFLLFIAYAFIRRFITSKNTVDRLILLATILILSIASMIPSSLMIFNCLWIFIGALLIRTFYLKTDQNLDQR